MIKYLKNMLMLSLLYLTITNVYTRPLLEYKRATYSTTDVLNLTKQNANAAIVVIKSDKTIPHSIKKIIIEQLCKSHDIHREDIKGVRHNNKEITSINLWKNKYSDTGVMILSDNALRIALDAGLLNLGYTLCRELNEGRIHNASKIIDILNKDELEQAKYGGSDNALIKTFSHSHPGVHLECFKKLLAKGVNVNIANSIDETPLFFATALNADPEVIDLLLQHNADVNIQDTQREYFPLLFATRYQNYDTAEKLIKAGANVNTIAKDGTTALIQAYKNNDMAMIHLLKKHGALDQPELKPQTFLEKLNNYLNR